jgi:hypothetical protein
MTLVEFWFVFILLHVVYYFGTREMKILFFETLHLFLLLFYSHLFSKIEKRQESYEITYFKVYTTTHLYGT